MPLIRFKIPGVVRGKGRPRFARRGQYVKTYTDKDTELYENWVKSCFIHSKLQAFEKDIPLYCQITVFCEIPESRSKKVKAKMANNEMKPTKKPDCDNIAKSILDGLNKIAFHDDTQISTLVVSKFYTTEEPYAVVTLCEDTTKLEGLL